MSTTLNHLEIHKSFPALDDIAQIVFSADTDSHLGVLLAEHITPESHKRPDGTGIVLIGESAVLKIGLANSLRAQAQSTYMTLLNKRLEKLGNTTRAPQQYGFARLGRAAWMMGMQRINGVDLHTLKERLSDPIMAEEIAAKVKHDIFRAVGPLIIFANDLGQFGHFSNIVVEGNTFWVLDQPLLEFEQEVVS